MTTIFVAAAASPWLAPVINLLGAQAAVELWAPWSLPALVPQRFARPGLTTGLDMSSNTANLVTSASWFAAHALTRVWSRRSRARSLWAALLQRRALAWWTTQRLQRLRRNQPALTTIAACSLAAREPFAWARARGLRTVLLVDVPHFAVLHHDLDVAARRFPNDSYLQHFRAPSWAIAQQHAEFALADVIIVRGPYAANTITARTPRAGHQLEICSIKPQGPIIAHARSNAAPWLLAGPAAARSGFMLAAHAAQLAGRRLFARLSEATEPHYRSHPAVTWITDDNPQIPAVAAIIAPALCEAFLQFQPALGLPVVGSAKCAGVTNVCDLEASEIAELAQRVG